MPEFNCPQGHRWEAVGDTAAGPTVLRHVCPICGAAAETHVPQDSAGPASTIEAPTASGQGSRPAENFSAMVTKAAAPPASTECPNVPGYEILGELGRGGMGVVYKARQLSLKRIVALKMILSGAHAGAEQLTRFRTEAEAVARLQHPNIVQIHEIGEQNGLPYFSLEFVDGGSLAQKLAGKPLPPEKAAALAGTLARAVQYAHQQGVVHRDLKPANILLAVVGSQLSVASQEGKAASSLTTDNWQLTTTPKITDFGLAKQLGEDSGQTKSGAIVGTPSYMAPEQAAGQVHAIGPQTDVYSLGAILYELLTGRPPFRGRTVVETLEQVRLHEPVPPSRVQPRVPWALETICLKALGKEPASRYRSALALAQDLERFQAGESILARREGLPARLWRKVRRNRVAVASLLLVVLALGMAGYVYWRAGDSRRIAELDQAIEAGLDTADWTPDYFETEEALLADLERLAPDHAAAARQRVNQRFEKAIGDWIWQPKLEPAEVARIEAALDVLDARDAGRAQARRAELQKRLRTPDQVLNVRPPFQGLEGNRLTALFAPPYVRVAGATLVCQVPAGVKREPLIRLQVPSPGDVQLEAVFGPPSWETASELGLIFNSSDTDKGYTFLLQTLALSTAEGGEPEPGPLPSFAACRKAGGLLNLQILRNGVRLRQQHIKAAEVPAGPLRLRAERDGDRLTFLLNQLEPLRFQDAFLAASSSAGCFGLHWPDGVHLESVQAWSQALPAVPSPLERGDYLHARGLLREALAEYRSQANTVRDADELRQEARYKEAVCLAGLKRYGEAGLLFQQLAEQPGPRWPLLARYQLWLIHLREKRYGEADVLFADLYGRSGSEFKQRAALLIPDDLREAILNSYSDQAAGHHFYEHDPERVKRFRRAMEVDEILDAPLAHRYWTRWFLLRALRADNQLPQAIALAEEVLRQSPVEETSPAIQYAQEYGWLMRNRGQPERALHEIDRRLFEAPGVYRTALLPLLIERSRLHAAQQRWPEAEKDLDDFFRLVPADKMSYAFFAAASLMKGFLCEQRGDRTAALAAWRQGMYRNWVQTLPQGAPRPEENTLGATSSFLFSWIMAGLTDTLADDEAEKVAAQLTATFGSPDATSRLGLSLLPPSVLHAMLPPALFRDMWRSPRGRAGARQIAFREPTFLDTVRLPMSLLFFQKTCRDALPDAHTPEQEDAAWQHAEALTKSYLQGEMSKRSAIQLALAWEGYANLASVAELIGKLGPGLRGSLNYFFGQRALRLGKREEATTFFTAVLKQTPADSRLGRLAQAELDRMKAK
jgi:serine/threonine protein kinase